MPRKKKTDICDEVEDVSQECSELMDLAPVEDWIQTGCTILDFAISNRFPGGIPAGRITQIYGGSSTAKSLFAYTTMGYAQRAGYETYYDDTERSINPEFAHMCGMDMSHPKFHMWSSETIEELFDKNIGGLVKQAEAIRESNKKEKDKKKHKNIPKKLVVVDSITVLPAEIEQEKKMDEQGYGAYRAKQIHLGLRSWARRALDNGITILVIDQTRANVKSPFASETTVGGLGLEFWSSVRIYLKSKAKIQNAKKVNIGTWVDSTVVKTRFGPAFRGGLFRIQYSYGLDDIYSNLALLAKCQGVEDKALMLLTTKVEFKGEEYTIKKWVNVVEDEGLEDELRQQVWKSWQELYASDPRKERKW